LEAAPIDSTLHKMEDPEITLTRIALNLEHSKLSALPRTLRN
tara:strand:- start:145 stop:270 length:126 start_codon:yes stop_codon:yes gene_type:complete